MMRPSACATGLSLLLLAACGRGASGPDDAPQDACLSDVPVRLAAPPGGWEADGWKFGPEILQVGEHLVFQVGPDYYQIDVCGGPALRLDLPPGSGLTVHVVSTAAGPRLYGVDRRGKLYLLDRLEVDGPDRPSEIGSFRGNVFLQPSQAGDRVLFYGRRDADRPWYRAAGLGSEPFTLLLHDGGRDAAALLRDDIVVLSGGSSETERLALVESGDLLRVDLATDEATPLLAGVRAAFVSPDRTRVVWQQLGDDVAEPVFLRAFAGGGDRLLAVNDFAAQSWGRAGDVDDVGAWRWTSDSRFVAQIGVDGRLVAAARADTGAAIEVPEHTAFRGSFAGGYQLTLPDPSERVEALWSPEDGDLLVFWRGPERHEPHPEWSAGTVVYFSVDTGEPGVRSLQRVDRSTGATAEVLSNYAPHPAEPREDGRIWMSLRVGEGDHDMVLADPATGEVEMVVEGVSASPLVVPGRGLYYFDFLGDEPGLWFAPIPGE